MPKYTVCVREVWVKMVEIEAADEEAAKKKVENGHGVHVNGGFEYSTTLDPSTWTVDKHSGEAVDTKKTTRRVRFRRVKPS